MPVPRIRLPAWAGLGVLWSALPVARRLRFPAWVGTAVAVGPLCAVLLVIGLDRRWDPVAITDDPDTPQPDGDLSIEGIANERLVYVLLAGNDHPVTYDNYEEYVEYPLLPMGRLPLDGLLVDLGGSGREEPADEPMLVAGSIGLVGYRFLGTHVIDQLSLAEPLGAHMEAGQAGRPGHEKILSWEWLVARFADVSVEHPVVDDARAALGCGDLEELVDAVEEPLTPGRFLRNLVGSVDRTRLRVPPDPAEARAAFCG